jgi:hypothetical protein
MMVVPVPVQHAIVSQAPLVAYAPTKLPAGWRYKSWQGSPTMIEIVFRGPGGAEADFFVLPLSGECSYGAAGSSGGVYWSKGPARWSAWRCVNGFKLWGDSLVAAKRLSQVALVRLVASARRLH